MNFSERLKYLRAENHISQIKLAQILDVTDRTVRKYEAKEIEPTLSILISLADYFNVSLDYLTGRSETKERQP